MSSAHIQVSTAQTVESAPDRPLKRDVELHAVIPDERVVWSRCAGPDGAFGLLNVNFRAALTASAGAADAHGYFGGGRNSTVTERWGWVWRRC